MIRRLAIALIVTTGLFGCEPGHPDISLSEYHPAEPDAEEGQAIAAPAALRPELQTATPLLLMRVPRKAAPAPAAPKLVAPPPATPKPAAPGGGGDSKMKM